MMTKHKTKPNFGYKDIMSYESPPEEFQSCQSHLSEETLEQMRRDFELSKRLNTSHTIHYLMKQDHTTNLHLVHWLSTGLGRHWIEEQEGRV